MSEQLTTEHTAHKTHTLQQQIEALLLIAAEPVEAAQLASELNHPIESVRAAIQTLRADYDGELHGPRRGFELRQVAGGYRLYVRQSLDQLVTGVVRQQSQPRLSQAALETLAVIAYRQPISRGAVASVRAVNVDGVVRTLIARGLIVEVGRDAQTGATLYGTDERLLRYLGIDSLDELPPISALLDDPGESFDE